jgi:hypothetical protein
MRQTGAQKNRDLAGLVHVPLCLLLRPYVTGTAAYRQMINGIDFGTISM